MWLSSLTVFLIDSIPNHFRSLTQAVPNFHKQLYFNHLINTNRSLSFTKMKIAIIVTALAACASAGTLHGRKGKTAAGTANAAAAGAVQKGTTTMVLKEVGGIAGNECLTFRNNGESRDSVLAIGRYTRSRADTGAVAQARLSTPPA